MDWTAAFLALLEHIAGVVAIAFPAGPFAAVLARDTHQITLQPGSYRAAIVGYVKASGHICLCLAFPQALI